MCDTLVALGNSTSNGSVIFGKNSDRDPNEAHQLLLIPESNHLLGELVKCTYISIPQVKKTNRILLAKPFWIWGGEMGANEHGVAIGNEAIFTKQRNLQKPGLIGMDFLRLALERASTACQALEVITALLEEYGQGGNCGYSHPFFYQNSFLIADRKEAWVLETIDRQWAAINVNDIYAISNEFTIQEEWDLSSKNLIPYAREHGWLRKGETINFRRCFSDYFYTKFSGAKIRRKNSMNMLLSQKGSLSISSFIEILRTHQDSDYSDWQTDKGFTRQDVCMHAGFGPIRINQTVGSMISNLSSNIDTHWVTGTSAPCLSVFKPVWLDAGLPDVGHEPGEKYDAAQLWWRFERLHREVLKNYSKRLSTYDLGRNELEEGFIRKSFDYSLKNKQERYSYSNRCFSTADQYSDKWLKEVLLQPSWKTDPFYRWSWSKLNKRVNIPE